MIFRDDRDGCLNFDNHESVEKRIEILKKYLKLGYIGLEELYEQVTKHKFF